MKARDFRRKPEHGGRWNAQDFDKFVGVHWEPYPGMKGGFELKSKVRLPADSEEFTKTAKGDDDCVPRRLRIRKEDLERFGYTAGCPGCRAANRGTTAVNHTEDCRRRIVTELEKIGDERIERERKRWHELL